MQEKGLFIVYTGNGKGKTTAALGLALRAAGHGLKVCIIQFIKSLKQTGEAKAITAWSQQIEFHTAGSGFTWAAKDPEEPRQAARAGWDLAESKIASAHYHMVILDEFTYPLAYGYLDENAVLSTFAARPAHQHLVITGRGASDRLIAAADLVTEMREIKHPFQQNAAARQGIEF